MDERTRCLAVLGLTPSANWESVKQAYKDLVQVWHPDRFAHNPRLQKDAQEKLKEINLAFEWLTRNWSKGSQVAGHEQPKEASAKSSPPRDGAKSVGLRVAGKLYRTVYIFAMAFGILVTSTIWLVTIHDAGVHAQAKNAVSFEPPSDKVPITAIATSETYVATPEQARLAIKSGKYSLPSASAHLVEARPAYSSWPAKHAVVESKEVLRYLENNIYGTAEWRLSTANERNIQKRYDYINARCWGSPEQGKADVAVYWLLYSPLSFLPALVLVILKKWLGWLIR